MDFAAIDPDRRHLRPASAIMWICYKYLELRVVGRKAVEEAAREHAEKKKLEARLAVLERIVTDRGIQTAEQIDALMERERQPEQRLR